MVAGNCRGGPLWPPVSWDACVFQGRAATEGRPYNYALEDLTFEDLLSPHEKAEEQLAKNAQALERFFHNAHAWWCRSSFTSRSISAVESPI